MTAGEGERGGLSRNPHFGKVHHTLDKSAPLEYNAEVCVSLYINRRVHLLIYVCLSAKIRENVWLRYYVGLICGYAGYRFV